MFQGPCSCECVKRESINEKIVTFSAIHYHYYHAMIRYTSYSSEDEDQTTAVNYISMSMLETAWKNSLLFFVCFTNVIRFSYEHLCCIIIYLLILLLLMYVYVGTLSF